MLTSILFIAASCGFAASQARMEDQLFPQQRVTAPADSSLTHLQQDVAAAENQEPLRDNVIDMAVRVRLLQDRLTSQDERLRKLEMLMLEKCGQNEKLFQQTNPNTGSQGQDEDTRPTAKSVEDTASAVHLNRKSSEVKRADDFGVLEPIVAQITQRLAATTADMLSLKNTVLNNPTGSSYVRWGYASCPNGTDTIYSGEMGGGWYASYGAPVNHLCLPDNPVVSNHTATTYMAELYGAEYQLTPEPVFNMNPSCAVCHTSRSSVIMLPATNVCKPGWQLEYSGYLMAGLPSHPASTEYICVDSGLGYRPDSQADNDGVMLHYVMAHCGSLPCPPYVQGKIILCAVCSK